MKKAAFSFLLVACSTETMMQPPPPPPPEEWKPQATCRTPAIPDGPWFTEITADVGLAKNGDFEPVATSIIAGDIDNDGFVDFIATFFPSQREPAGTKHTRFVFMNRPNPDDPSQRIF